MINLPTKDKFGNSYLSYSQISTFLKSKEDYYKRYILKEPFVSNKYIDFGNKVGKALQENDYSLFMKREKEVLNKVTRLDIFERKTILNYDDFYIIGFIDTCSEDLTKIIDYKTGGLKKEFDYVSEDYNQLVYYALSLRQETGVNVNEASVEFIRRKGNAFRGEALTVADEEPIKIEIDLNENRLKKVYYETIKIAKEIELFYVNKLT